MSIVERIRTEGAKKNLSISSIEKMAGISNGTISKWDKSTPSSDKLYKVSTLLNCSMEYLFAGISNSELNPEIKNWILLYEQLSHCDEHIKDECIGFVKGYIKRGETVQKT
jgi:transcriptional regulator with XRE-family HTH domain